MKLPHLTSFVFVLGTALVLVTPGCDRGIDAAGAGSGAAAAAPVAPAPEKPQPTQARLLERARERWQHVMQRDFIAAYDFHAPEVKRERAPANYEADMRQNKYEDARLAEVVSLKDETAYLRVNVLWTSLNEKLKKVELEPGQTFTQDISMIETWRWVGDDWHYVRPQRDDDFFSDHPELLRGETAPEAVPDTEKPAPAGG